MSSFFITGTGTDIGKTFLATKLIHHILASPARKPIDALKPVVSGFDPEKPEISDTGLLLAALGLPIAEPHISRISPWRFAAPLSPDMAAAREGRTLDFGALVRFTRRAVADSRGTLLIEGVGGVMVPLDQRRSVVDWIGAVDLPVILMTGSYLGALSHALTALEVLRHRKAGIAAIVINETPGSTVPLADTAETIQRFGGGIPLFVIQRSSSSEAIAAIATLLQGDSRGLLKSPVPT